MASLRSEISIEGFIQQCGERHALERFLAVEVVAPTASKSILAQCEDGLPPRQANLSALALVALLDEVVDQFARRVVHFDVEGFNASAEVVEGHNGGDGDQQAECSGNQSF
jgi:hypothetical protein